MRSLMIQTAARSRQASRLPTRQRSRGLDERWADPAILGHDRSASPKTGRVAYYANAIDLQDRRL